MPKQRTTLKIRYRRLEPGMTLADIQAAAALLRADISEKEPVQ